ncbi:PucR family transcriptional regulator [Nocardioides terrisoli]|uniref:PucR family transcriptional regulator n=1 Tax=Nocardioides terrisoli TaxID=3388267 RepID=UPI00287BA01F|nr:helix-turn-helix domain-containing protein [Nocardioides marmorisolisilvae]
MSATSRGFLAGHRAARLEALTDLLVAAIVDENAGYRTVPVVPLDDLRRSCHDNVDRVLELLGRSVAGEDVAEGPWYDAAVQTGHRRARQGFPLDDVLGSFRIGGRLIWQDLVEQADGDADLDADELRGIGTRLWEVVDRTSSHVARAYHEAERDLVRADEQRGAALWEELLRGRAREPAFAASAAQTLDLPAAGPYAAVALSGSVDDPSAHLGRVGLVSAWHRRTDAVIGVVALGRHGVSVVVSALVSSGARGGVSGRVADLAEIDTAFDQAAVTLRTVPRGVAQVAAYDDRLLAALLLDSPKVADRLVRRWLQPLLDLPPAESRVLLTTLRAWVDSGGAITRTAELAHCHRNTAMNRIARIGTLLDMNLGEGSVPVEIPIALVWLDLSTPAS